MPLGRPKAELILTDEHLRILVAWHKAFPLDEYERHCKQAVFKI